LDICADILRVALDGARKTRIVYQANLNFTILHKYMRRLMENGFLTQIEGPHFITTEKGCQFLEQYRNLIVPLKG